ncbi:hypothetical protein [Treponema sp.]|uniref:hypothetical protein n=1 Tax=Treponema sp. TaxID=166 RepID=UPI003F120F7F
MENTENLCGTNAGSRADKNRVKTLFFYLSATAFFCLSFRSYIFLAGIPFALAALHFALKKFDLEQELSCSIKLKAYCAFCTLAVCINGIKNFYFIRIFNETFAPNSRARVWFLSQGLTKETYIFIFTTVAVLGAAVGFFFCYTMILYVAKRVVRIIKENEILCITRAEKTVCCLIFAVYAVFTAGSYFNTNAFYPPLENSNNVLLSADSQLHIVWDNAFLSLAYFENDIRQPLFAVFSFPFFGIPYLISLLVPFEWSLPLFTSFANIALLILNSIILLKMFSLSVPERIFGLILLFCTFSHFYFSIVIEQYIVAYFYLMLVVFSYIKNKKLDVFSLYGASGTLLTSCAASILICGGHNDLQKFSLKKWFVALLKLAAGFLFIVIVCGRSDILFNSFSRLKLLSTFTGKSIPVSVRILQYFGSVPFFFIFPKAQSAFFPAVTENGVTNPEHFAWLYFGTDKVNFLGIAILVLCAASVFINRKNFLARFCVFWTVFAFIVTGIVGWGAGGEGGSYSFSLYCLYFGWSYFALLLLLARNIAEIFKKRWIVTLLLGVSAAVLVFANVPNAKQMLKFCLEHYPC